MVDETKNMPRNYTLCIVHKKDQVLLGMKKRGFGEGKWNGFGGKVQIGESIENASKRELCEEVHIQADKMTKLGMLDFTHSNTIETSRVHIYKCHSFQGEVKESEEMIPKWFSVKDIPFGNMWKDDAFWMPLFLDNKVFIGSFAFSENQEILEYKLKEVSASD